MNDLAELAAKEADAKIESKLIEEILKLLDEDHRMKRDENSQ